jgi:hypothetical protein
MAKELDKIEKKLEKEGDKSGELNHLKNGILGYQ